MKDEVIGTTVSIFLVEDPETNQSTTMQRWPKQERSAERDTCKRRSDVYFGLSGKAHGSGSSQSERRWNTGARFISRLVDFERALRKTAQLVSWHCRYYCVLLVVF